MNLRRLQYFVAVCELKSFTMAAERLFIAQPSLSQQIKRLETDLKVTLLDRTAQGIRPTPAGRALLPVARDILAVVERAEQAVDDARTGRRGDLEVLTVRSVANAILPSGIAVWHERFPEVVLEIKDYPHATAMEAAFRDGEGDLAIGPRTGLSGADVASIGFEELVLVAGPDSGVSTDAPLSLADLKGHQWVLFDKENGLTRVIRTLCAAAGFEPLAAVWTMQVQAALELASSGVAVTLVPDNAVQGEYRRFARSLTPPIYREICAYSRPGSRYMSDAYVDILCRAQSQLLVRADLPQSCSLT
ncbi:LysR family transcriptional regulator [Nocardia sp. NPDC049526]|uniref:LysR family transcriptional regulator n=1 Tax=Nocardia sp. NPDC049526 TaxID=3364316 RepID=UPI003792C469